MDNFFAKLKEHYGNDAIKADFINFIKALELEYMGVETDLEKAKEMEHGPLLEVDCGNTVSIVYRCQEGKEYTIGHIYLNVTRHIYDDYGCNGIQLFTYVPADNGTCDITKKLKSDENWKYETIFWNYRIPETNELTYREMRNHIMDQIMLCDAVDKLRNETFHKIQKLCEETNYVK
jgi:hypothetical protein